MNVILDRPWLRLVATVLLLFWAGLINAPHLGAQDKTGAEPADNPPNLLTIAEAEAKKQRALIDARIKSTLLQLGIYTDPTLDFVQQKMKEILSYDGYAVRLLVDAMENQSTERTQINAGRMAASILARINDPRVRPEVQRMLSGGNERAKINALHCVGHLGDQTSSAEIVALLESKNIELQSEALICLGLMKYGGTRELVAPILEGKDAGLHLAAIRALIHLSDPANEDLVIPIFASSSDLVVIETGVEFCHAFGTRAAVGSLLGLYEKEGLRRKQRWSIIRALTEVGKRAGSSDQEPIIAFLKKNLNSADNRTIKEVALALNELGDDTGVKVCTKQLDRLISRHSSAEYYFRRGEIFLEFMKYKQAQRDFNEGLRKDRKGGRYGAQVFVSLARCYAAETRFADAERTLRKAEGQDFTRLTIEYSEFRQMADDPRYAKVFRPGWK